MKHSKGDIVGGFTLLMLLKEKNGIETWRCRGRNGLLYAVKIGVDVGEKCAAEHSELYATSVDDGLIFRYVSGETLQARLARIGKCPDSDIRKFSIGILSQLSRLHSAGFSHCGICADNVMIDLSTWVPYAYLIGFGNAEPATVLTLAGDIRAVGSLMYLMAFGKEPGPRPRVRTGASVNIDECLVNVIFNALSGNFSSADTMIEVIEGRMEIAPLKTCGGDGFSAVAGLDDIKRRLQNDVIDILDDRDRATAYGIDIPNGMLLYGPPGCGKTFIAEKFAEQASFNYKYVKSSDLASTYLHGSQERIAALFNEARLTAPTILCFDEFDAFAPRRDDINNASQSAEVNEFLSQMNNCGRDGVFVIATTNRPDKIDSAALRTGRLDYLVYVPVPDRDLRREMFRLSLKDRPADLDIDLDYLAEATDGFITSDISAIVLSAARVAFKRRCNISMPILREVLETRRPSLSKEELQSFESLREQFESARKSGRHKKIGF